MHFKIPRLYDSHTHFLATGEFSSGLNLSFLKDPNDISTVSTNNLQFFRGEWLVGFGWNDSRWSSPPSKSLLDKIFPETPVFFARADGHSSWVNSRALERLGITSDTGILIEKDHLRAWEAIPQFSKAQQKQHIVAACREYNKSGFTHVRDMSCSDLLWNLLVEMSDSQELTVAIEENYTTHDLNDFDSILQSCLYAKKYETPILRLKGVKLFYDGSLGSETAYLSKPYYGKSGGSHGMTLWSLDDVEQVIRRTWVSGLEFSVHVIGDQAAHEMVQLARKISAQGAVGRLNLEHAQILRPETIQMMKPLHVRCHMQPCHWLSDRVWLKDKLKDLYSYVFPWGALSAAQIPLSFGCDSPIEPPSFLRNKIALEESVKENIKKFNGNLTATHSHPDAAFANSYTVIEDGVVKEINFCGKSIDI